MDAFPESAEERQALVERHDQLRDEVDVVYEQLVEATPQDDVVVAAKDLGLWRRGGIATSDEEDFYGIFDVALFGSYERRGLIADWLEDGAVESGSRSETVLRALGDSRFSIFEVVELVPDLGLELHDRMRDERTRIVDPKLATSPTLQLNGFLVGRLVELDGVTLVASNCLSLDAEYAAIIAEVIQSGVERDPESMRWLNASILRGVMTAKHGAPQTPVRSTKVGRNEPCPCGSGKKYKKCCAD